MIFGVKSFGGPTGVGLVPFYRKRPARGDLCIYPMWIQQEAAVCKPERGLSPGTEFAVPGSWTLVQNCEKPVSIVEVPQSVVFCYNSLSWQSRSLRKSLEKGARKETYHEDSAHAEVQRHKNTNNTNTKIGEESRRVKCWDLWDRIGQVARGGVEEREEERKAFRLNEEETGILNTERRADTRREIWICFGGTLYLKSVSSSKVA